eukprot:2950751-Pleurochrysis_carterae.AAC.1
MGSVDRPPPYSVTHTIIKLTKRPFWVESAYRTKIERGANGTVSEQNERCRWPRGRGRVARVRRACAPR